VVGRATVLAHWTQTVSPVTWTGLGFYVPLDSKCVISEMFFSAGHLKVATEETKTTQQKQTCADKPKDTTTQNKHRQVVKVI